MCGRRYTPEPKARGYPEALRQQAVALYSDGLSFRRIARQLGVNHQTVVNWINAYIARLPDQAPQPEGVRVVEMDELQTFIRQKKALLHHDIGRPTQQLYSSMVSSS